MDGIPTLYVENNVFGALCNPSGISVTNTALSAFFRRYLLQRAMSVFKWNLPENWNKKYFLYALYLYGSVAVFNTDKFGVIPQACTLGGYNVFYQPLYARIANPLIKSTKPLVIDRDCALFTMTEDYNGIADLVNYYGDMMALTAESAGVNVINSRLAYIFFAKNKNIAESMKAMMDDITSGKPAVVVDKALKRDKDGNLDFQQFEQNLNSNFIAPDLMELLRTIENQFDCAVGINNCNQSKKERQIVDEVNANNEEIFVRADMWLEGWRETCAKINKMFGVNVSVDWRVKRGELVEG